LSPDEFRAHGHELVEWIARYFETVRERPVLAGVKPGEVADSLPRQGPEQPEPFARIFDDFNETILPGSTLWNHPRFFAYYAVSSSPPSILAEFLAAALNQNGILWKSGPALTELEQVTLGWLRQWLSLPEQAFGIIYDTASTSTLHALVAARQAVDPDTRRAGAARGLTVYTSDQAHSSVEKDALALGFGEENVRKIDSDAEFRMRPDALREAIAADLRAGKRPCCVVASIGATPAATVDPVAAILPIVRDCGAWLHVDAAYAGPAALLPECAWMFERWGEADSIVLNPHKWMLVNVDLSVLYLLRPQPLRDALSLTPDYLRTAQDPRMLNYMDYSIALGRRFRALKLWFALRTYGREGIVSMLRQHIADAQWLRDEIASDPRFEIAAPVHLSLVCFRMKASDEANHRLMDAMNDSGFAFLSHTTLHGRFVLRFAVGNFLTTRDDISATWRKLQEIADTLV
jgi:aromatic-L-amino-acid decarboxylase